MAIKVIVLDVHRVRVFTNRHAPIIRVVSIAEKVKTRVVSVPRVLVQACRAARHSPESMVSHAVAAIVLVPVIIREEKKAAISPVSRAAIVLVLSMVSKAAIVLVLSMVSRVRESKANMASSVVAISLAAAISPVSRVAISLAEATSPVSRVVMASSVVATSSVAVTSKVATSLRANMVSLVAAISPVSRVVLVPSVVASRSSVAAMIPMPSIR